jgi:diadenosine tetraphosphate (Ap4A) HIT family hydrolase
VRTAQQICAQVHQQLHSYGFDLGANEETAGGRTVNHAQLHLISRIYLGDVPEPKDGISRLVSEQECCWVDGGSGERQ